MLWPISRALSKRARTIERDGAENEHDESHAHGEESERLDIGQAELGADEAAAPQHHEQSRRGGGGRITQARRGHAVLAES